PICRRTPASSTPPSSTTRTGSASMPTSAFRAACYWAMLRGSRAERVSAPTDLGKQWRRIRPFRHIRKMVKRWRHNFGVHLGLQSGPATHGYMICATQRSGSSYLSQLLASTRCLGNPAEYFNTPAWRKTDSKYPKDPRAQFEIVRSLGATPNGIYGVKAHAFQIARMGEGIDPFRELPNLKLVRLLRSDMLSRAISLSRAKQSRQYSSM